MKTFTSLLLISLDYSSAFSNPSSSHHRWSLFNAGQSSYEFDSDESAEQGLARVKTEEGEELVNGKIDSVVTAVSSGKSSNSRYDSVLEEVGLAGKLSSLNDLPQKRRVHADDVFCNRELKLSNIQAVGFDMDYTLAQYKQPAFDKLAFDGAKEKLVHKFGYPKELLDVEYDHTVSFIFYIHERIVVISVSDPILFCLVLGQRFDHRHSTWKLYEDR
jgi:hypothetical protein